MIPNEYIYEGIIGIFAACCVAAAIYAPYFMAKMSGWKQLAQLYPDTGKFPKTNRWLFRSIVTDWATYRGGVHIALDDDGIHFRIWGIFRLGHPPIFVPWENVFASDGKRLFFPVTALSFFKASNITFTILSRSLGRAITEKIAEKKRAARLSSQFHDQ